MLSFDRDHLLAFALVLLAAVGGLLGSLVRMIEAKEQIRWVTVTVETLASGFAGVLVVLLCNYLTLDIRLTGVIVGVCGWVGGRTAMVWLEKRVKPVVTGPQPNADEV